MRKDLFLPLAILAITAGGYGLFDAHLKSQDTSMSGYLSGTMMNMVDPPSNQLIRVNQYNHQLAMYENHQLYKVAKIAATGNPNDRTRTPVGDFRILSKEKMHRSRLSGVLMPLAMRFHEGYYFHDIPLTPNGASRITTRYSHGCIRLPSDLVQEVYDWTRVGAYVQVYRAWLVKDATSATVYKLTEDGFRQPIASEAAFIAHGFRWEDVAIVPTEEVYSLPLGQTLY